MLAVDMVADSSFGPASLPIVLECKLLAGWLRQVWRKASRACCLLEVSGGRASSEQLRGLSALIGGASPGRYVY